MYHSYLQCMAAEFDEVTVSHMYVCLSPGRSRDDGFDARHEFLQQACACDVVSVDMGVDAVLKQ